MTVRSALRAGVLSPTRPVPKSIPRPEYVGKPTAREGHEPWVQTPEVIEKMRVAGRIAARALAEADNAVAPGVTTDVGLQGFSEILLHVAQRDHLPRHPGLDRDRGR